MTEIKDVSKLLWYHLDTIPVLQKHRKFERKRGCNYSSVMKQGLSSHEWLQWNCESTACFEETQ